MKHGMDRGVNSILTVQSRTSSATKIHDVHPELNVSLLQMPSVLDLPPLPPLPPILFEG